MRFYDVKKMYLNQLESEICFREYQLQFLELDFHYRKLIRERLDVLFTALIKRDL